MVVLSIVQFLRDRLTAGGWSSVRIIDKFPDNLDAIVLENPGPDQIALPLMAIETASTLKGSLLGIGDTVRESFYRIAIFIYAKEWSQEIDLREYVTSQLQKYDIGLYDYSGGFPDANASLIGPIEIVRVSSVPDHIPMSENAALRWGGVISVLTKIYI